MSSIDSGVMLYPYKCEKCGYTVTYDKPQKEYENGFVCGGHAEEVNDEQPSK